MPRISDTLSLIFYFYYVLIIIRIVLSWIPSIDFSQQPFNWIRSVTDPFLNIFRGIIPPIGGALDISPILAILLLQLLSSIIVGFLRTIVL